MFRRWIGIAAAGAIALVVLASCSPGQSVSGKDAMSTNTRPAKPSGSAVPADQAVAVAKERLGRTGWWLPHSARHVTVTLFNDADMEAGHDVAVIEFDASRAEIQAMVPRGVAAMSYYPADTMDDYVRQMLSGTTLPRDFQYADAETQTTFPPKINVLILPAGDNPHIIVLSYILNNR